MKFKKCCQEKPQVACIQLEGHGMPILILAHMCKARITAACTELLGSDWENKVSINCVSHHSSDCRGQAPGGSLDLPCENK